MSIQKKSLKKSSSKPKKASLSMTGAHNKPAMARGEKKSSLGAVKTISWSRD